MFQRCSEGLVKGMRKELKKEWRRGEEERVNLKGRESKFSGSWTECLKTQPCDVINMKEMRAEVGKKTPKKDMDNLSFF